MSPFHFLFLGPRQVTGPVEVVMPACTWEVHLLLIPFLLFCFPISPPGILIYLPLYSEYLVILYFS